MEKNNTKVCILLSAYNGTEFIEEQLDSLLKQKDANFHILIRDDGSTDDTMDILQTYKKSYPELIDIISGKNVGFVQSFTSLTDEAYSRYPDMQYFAFCDQDDVWLPNKLNAGIRMLEQEDKTIPVTYCSNTTLVDKDLNIIRQTWDYKKVKITKERSMIQNFATGCTMIFNRTAARLYMRYIPKSTREHDYFLFQLCVFLGKVIWDKESYIYYRQHGHNQIGMSDFKGRLHHRLARFRNKELNKRNHETRNYDFMNALKEVLPMEDIAILSSIVFYRRNIWSKLSLIFDRKIKYNNFESNFFYILKIISGNL